MQGNGLGKAFMHIRVKDGHFDPDNISGDEIAEPNGKEIWEGVVDTLTITSLRDASIQVEPGEWYPFATFKDLVDGARLDDRPLDETVFSTVVTKQSGVAMPWEATIGIRDASAALMVCRSLVNHIEQLPTAGMRWVRVE